MREVAWRVSFEVTLRYSIDDATSCPFICFTAPGGTSAEDLLCKRKRI